MRGKCENAVNAALAQILSDAKIKQSDDKHLISRTALYRYEKYRDMERMIDKATRTIAQKQITAVDKLVDDIFAETVGKTYAQLSGGENNSFNFLPQKATSEYVNLEWSGDSYSSRIWQNRDALAEHLKSDIMEAVLLGRNSKEITRVLADDFNVGWYQADRIIRTESMYVYNRAAIVGYKESQVEQVQLIVSKDERLCEHCNSAAGIYDINAAPLLPMHPNCRCCYAPVVKIF